MADLEDNPVFQFLEGLVDAVRDEESPHLSELRFEITAEELREHFRDRANHHRMKKGEYEKRAEMLKESQGEEEKAVSANPVDRQERKAEDHADQAAYFGFLAEHVVEGQTYRLDQSALRSYELTPKYQ